MKSTSAKNSKSRSTSLAKSNASRTLSRNLKKDQPKTPILTPRQLTPEQCCTQKKKNKENGVKFSQSTKRKNERGWSSDNSKKAKNQAQQNNQQLEKAKKRNDNSNNREMKKKLLEDNTRDNSQEDEDFNKTNEKIKDFISFLQNEGKSEESKLVSNLLENNKSLRKRNNKLELENMKLTSKHNRVLSLLSNSIMQSPAKKESHSVSPLSKPFKTIQSENKSNLVSYRSFNSSVNPLEMESQKKVNISKQGTPFKLTKEPAWPQTSFQFESPTEISPIPHKCSFSNSQDSNEEQYEGLQQPKLPLVDILSSSPKFTSFPQGNQLKSKPHIEVLSLSCSFENSYSDSKRNTKKTDVGPLICFTKLADSMKSPSFRKLSTEQLFQLQKQAQIQQIQRKNNNDILHQTFEQQKQLNQAEPLHEQQQAGNSNNINQESSQLQVIQVSAVINPTKNIKVGQYLQKVDFSKIGIPKARARAVSLFTPSTKPQFKIKDSLLCKKKLKVIKVNKKKQLVIEGISVQLEKKQQREQVQN